MPRHYVFAFLLCAAVVTGAFAGMERAGHAESAPTTVVTAATTPDRFMI